MLCISLGCIWITIFKLNCLFNVVMLSFFQKNIGDGICDADNNREHCEWDGGDCCPSTVEGGKVDTIPIKCPIDCQCRDPAAIENRRRRRRHKLKYIRYIENT